MTELLEEFTPEERARFQEGLANFRERQEQIRRQRESRSSDRYHLRDER